MQFEKFTQSKEEQSFAAKFNTQRDNIRQRGDHGKGGPSAGGPGSDGTSIAQSKAAGIGTIDLDEEQRPYGNNYFNLFEPIPVAGDDKTPPAGRSEYAGDNTRNSRRTQKGGLRVQSAILHPDGEAEQPNRLGVAAGNQPDAMSETLRDNDNLDSSQSDSQMFSGIAVIDGKNARRPDGPTTRRKARGTKQFAPVRLSGTARTGGLAEAGEPSEPRALQDEVVFSNMLIDDGRKNPSTDNRYRILNQSRSRRTESAQVPGTAEAATGEVKAPADAGMTEFKSTMKMTESLVGILNLSKTVQLDDNPTM